MKKIETHYVIITEKLSDSVYADIVSLIVLLIAMYVATTVHSILWEVFILLLTIGFLLVKGSGKHKKFTDPQKAIEYIESTKGDEHHGI